LPSIPAPVLPVSGDPVLVGAGDIADCALQDDSATAALIEGIPGNVFTAEVIHYWIKYKRENEVDALRIRPHPYEFCMYFDI
jgi:glutamine synthetase